MNGSSVNDLTDRKTICRLLREAGVRPSKGRGQNFLLDRAVLASIVDIVAKARPNRIVEIGSGLGTITREVAPLAERIVAVEVDRRLAGVLQRTVGMEEAVEIRCQDILEFDFSGEASASKVFVVGSIPYHITAPILRCLVNYRTSISAAVFLTQHEVAEKIAASPGPAGTALGIFIQAYADVNLIQKVGRRGFYPVPDVDSSLWMLTFLDTPRFTTESDVFLAVVAAIYGARRKMLRGALRTLLSRPEIDRVLEVAGIDGTVRGETLSFAELDRLAGEVSKQESWPAAREH